MGMQKKLLKRKQENLKTKTDQQQDARTSQDLKNTEVYYLFNLFVFFNFLQFEYFRIQALKIYL